VWRGSGSGSGKWKENADGDTMEVLPRVSMSVGAGVLGVGGV
jgi:hypothetical protein